MLQTLPLLVVVAVVAVTALALRRRDGVARPDHGWFTAEERGAAGVDARRPTFVVFTAPGCSTCGPARDLVVAAAARSGAAVVVVDASRHEDLAQAHRVLRAPTIFLVHPDGRIAGRISGLPRDEELARLVGSPSHGVAAAA